MSKYIVWKIDGGMQAVTPQLMTKMYAAMSVDERREFLKLSQASKKEKPDLPPNEVWVNVYDKKPSLYCNETAELAQKRGVRAAHRAVSYIRRGAILATLPTSPHMYLCLVKLMKLLRLDDD